VEQSTKLFSSGIMPGMSNHPINLGVRFVLELAALGAFAYWGWTQHGGIFRLLWSLGLPLFAALLWGVFRVPEDHGKGLVAVPGAVRLLLEVSFFAGAVWCLFAAGSRGWALTLTIITSIHYIVSYDRVGRLLRG
jgi:hypothetical protein